ncbi:hypothetical protein GUA87_01225 [Sneathiella sp. P13V-1]|uniref:hypothetical protein n=1 Tax=Sneathiella sp. P13V-1 TaxID=2697366 RepID=UPI00187BA7D2|nr:hypothetical protein [Sneathiella sp. P13V-1]MBE7635450.1 hypothetical protein [Sneathiella sp. P13V-1]
MPLLSAQFGNLRAVIALSVAVMSLVTFGNVHEGHATSRECLAQKIEPQVIFNHEDVATTLNHNLSSSQITELATSGSANSHLFSRLRGLASVFVQPKYGIEVRELEMRSGVKCVWLLKAKMTFDTIKSEVFVDRKYRKGTCEFDAVLSHEKEHISIYARVKRKYEAILRDRLTRWAHNMQPVQVSVSTSGADLMTKRLIEDMQPIIVEHGRVGKRESSKIDTESSYRRVDSRCSNW